MAKPNSNGNHHEGKTWVIVGASRGIGLEFVRQILDSGSQQRVVAAVRDVSNALKLYEMLDSLDAEVRHRCIVEMCDVAREEGIAVFIRKMQHHVNNGMRIGNVVLNAGILNYPTRATELSFSDFAGHLYTNTIGPVICAQGLLKLILTTEAPSSSLPSDDDTPRLNKLVFISSDSGSATEFLAHEDGFAAYAASKSALNQAVRHMAAELQRKTKKQEEESRPPAAAAAVVVLAMHPGEVKTDMAANMDLAWDVPGQITPAESVAGMLQVIASKGEDETGTFWRWDGKTQPW